MSDRFSMTPSMRTPSLGAILHHDTDKVHLGAGSAEPAFGGGTVVEPIYVLVEGRATTAVDGEELPVDGLAQEAVATNRWRTTRASASVTGPGRRPNGLITPHHPMSLEATAGRFSRATSTCSERSRAVRPAGSQGVTARARPRRRATAPPREPRTRDRWRASRRRVWSP